MHAQAESAGGHAQAESAGVCSKHSSFSQSVSQSHRDRSNYDLYQSAWLIIILMRQVKTEWGVSGREGEREREKQIK